MVLFAIVVAALLLLLTAPLVVLAQTQLAKKRWGTTEGPIVERSEGAYRGEVVRSEIERGAPAGLTAGSFLAALWAAFTLAIVVPLGVLATGALLNEAPRYGIGHYLLALAVGVFTTSSALVSIAMLTQCVRLARRHTGSIEQTLRVVRFSHAHHGLAWFAAAVGAAIAMPHDALLISLVVGVPCFLGVVAGLALQHAANEALTHRRSELFRVPDDLSAQGASEASIEASTPSTDASSIDASSIDDASIEPSGGSSTSGRTKFVSS